MNIAYRIFINILLSLALSLHMTAVQAKIDVGTGTAGERIDLSFKDTPIREVYQMLSLQNNVNIILSDDVEGTVSLNLYRVTVEYAIRSIAESSGYVAEKRGGTFVIVAQDQTGKDAVNGNTDIRSYKIQYTDIATVNTLITSYLSRYGKITMIEQQSLLVIEDMPDFLAKIEKLIALVDKAPRQILIEAKILEIGLRHDESFGINWSIMGGDGSIGTRGFASTTAPGLFLEVVTPDINVFLNALSEDGRVRTLSTPKLLVLENQEAEVIIGERTGYRVTSTINLVTSESIEFLDSGVILKVTASVDRQNRIMLKVHPEVSTATVTAGIPSLSTTEVTTQLLANNGQNILIAGLIKRSEARNKSSVTGLGTLPGIGGLFSSDKEVGINTETVILITPRIVDQAIADNNRRLEDRIGSISTDMIIDDSPVFDPVPELNDPQQPIGTKEDRSR
jgi:type II secretory pathway component GspD/PulD (secretin)